MSADPPRTVLITGASGGIGAATARLLSRRGLAVMLVARRADRLAHLAADLRAAGGRAWTIPADLSREEERQRVYDLATRQVGPVDVLVNNAGLGWYGYAAEMPWTQALELLQVNVEAAVHLSLLFLADMQARQRGHIINIGSIAGSLPSQGVAIYGATKAFLDNFTSALHRELSGQKVSISILRAGAVRTDFCETAERRAHGRRLPTASSGMAVERVAAAVWDIIRRPRRVVYVPRMLQVVPWLELGFGWLLDRLGPLLLRRARDPG